MDFMSSEKYISSLMVILIEKLNKVIQLNQT